MYNTTSARKALESASNRVALALLSDGCLAVKEA